MTKRRLHFLPDAGIQLGVVGTVDPRTARRFARLFKAAWHAIPARHRRPIVRQWLECCPSKAVSIYGPGVWARPEIAAECNTETFAIRFKAAFVERASDLEVMFTAAHELGHAHCVVRELPTTEKLADAFAVRVLERHAKRMALQAS